MNDIIYSFGNRENVRKMWATSRKCVFYDIFKNITKHQKIFFETFFEMQPNTWKYFLFQKIAFPKNIYFPEILLYEPNAALKLDICPVICFDVPYFLNFLVLILFQLDESHLINSTNKILPYIWDSLVFIFALKVFL